DTNYRLIKKRLSATGTNYAVPEEDIPGLADEGNDPSLASGPAPVDEDTDIARDTLLSWNPGINAVTNDVYLGMVRSDVNDATRDNPNGLLLAQDAPSEPLNPGLLDFGQTYFWRVDGIHSENAASPWKGDVWSFTVEPYAYPVENIVATASSQEKDTVGPENTINGSGLVDDLHGIVPEDMWLSGAVGPHWIRYDFDQVYYLSELQVWNSNQPGETAFGFGSRDVTIEVSTDGETWTTLDTVVFNQAPGTDGYAANTIIDMKTTAAQYVRFNIASNYSIFATQVGLSEVRFLYLPLGASQPNPADGAVDVDPSTVLGWRAGRRAVVHEVHLDSDMAKVADGSALRDTVEATSFDTSSLGLELGQEYYWKINEVNDATVWEGAIWSFATSSFIPIDDMESYSANKPIWESWEDGYVIDDNGSQVGDDNGDPERAIYLSPSQSLPLHYDNSTAPTSKATYTLPEGERDWTRGGAAYLVINVYGDPNNSGGSLYATINDTKVPFNGSGNPLTVAEWTQWNIDLAAAGIKQDDVTTLAIGVDDAAAIGVAIIDDVLLYKVLP
ncbi:discoidin domain-containing protein, partial [Planctomycetota bacterium]